MVVLVELASIVVHAVCLLCSVCPSRPTQPRSRNVQAQRPLCATLENVKGINRCLPQVLRYLRRSKAYFVTTVNVDPKDLGKPISRPRIYFLLVRRDVVLGNHTDIELEALAKMVVQKLKTKATCSLDNAVFKQNHRLVMQQVQTQTTLGRCKCTRCKKQQCTEVLESTPSKTACAWRHRHWQYLKPHGLDAKAVSNQTKGLPIIPGLRTLRTRHLCAMLMAKFPAASVLNVSQSPGRGSVSTGTLMTLTPRGGYYLVKQKRMLTAQEQLAMMGFPIFDLNLRGLTLSQMATMSGNAMESLSAASAFMATIRLLDFVKFKDAMDTKRRTKGLKRRAV